ncbi:hypothetical protein CR513_31291, partial [Mucuna pruriens]
FCIDSDIANSNSNLGVPNCNFVVSISQFSVDNMVENNKTLKELTTLDLKLGLIHLLPKFHGLACEDHHNHLKEFHVMYSTMKPHGILKDYIKMKAFPFSLDGVAKDWLYLQPSFIRQYIGRHEDNVLREVLPYL